MRLPGAIKQKLFNKAADSGEEAKISFAVLFELSTITVAAFSTSGDKVNIMVHRSAPFSGSIPGSVETLDSLFTGIAQILPETDKIEETIFGLSQEYVEGDGIKPEAKSQLKKLVEDLSLKPTGFVVISEALAYFLSSQSGMQESAIFVGVYPGEAQVSLMKIGNITEEKIVARTDNICLDVKSVLSDFKQEVLPAKIVLYDGTTNLGEIKEEFLEYAWDKESNFLHFPKIEVLPAQTTLQAVVGAYTQKNLVEMDGDINKIKPEDVGFSSENEPEEKLVEKQVETMESKRGVLSVKQASIQEGEQQSFRFPSLKMPSFSIKPKLGLVSGFIILLILLMTGAVLAQLFYSSAAELRIIVNTKPYEQELDFTLDPGVDKVDVDEKVVPGKTVTVTLKGEASADTKGTKLIGDPAVGKVTVYNKSTGSKTFSKGETLIAPNKIRYNLNEEVSVASASVKIESGSETKVYGKAQVSVVALDIGPDGNISGGTDLVFEDFASSEYSATTDEDFSGGTSREVSVVGKDDVVALRKQIVDKLEKEAKSNIESNKDDKITIVDGTIENEILSEKLSEKIGEQAKSVSMSAEVEFTALGFNPEDIALLLKQDAETEFPEGYEMRSGFSRQTILDKEINKNGSVDFKASFATTLVPDMDKSMLAQLVAGKKVSELENMLREQNNIGGFEVSFSKAFPFITPLRLPKADKLTVVISTR